MVKLDEHSLLLTGGSTGPTDFHSKVFLFQNNKWTQVTDMHNPRAWHSCELLANRRVLVAGGLSGMFNSGSFSYYVLQTTESLSFDDEKWNFGPLLPSMNFGGTMVTFEEETYHIGGIHIPREVLK